MTGPRTIDPDTLASLGAPALAAALIEHAASDAVLRKKLRTLLAGMAGPGKLASQLGTRIQAIGRASSMLDRDRYKPLLQELDHIRTTIATTLAAQAADTAITLLWDFVGIADRVMERTFEDGGQAEDLFDRAMADLGALIATDPKRDTDALAQRVLAMCNDGGFGNHSNTIKHFATALGSAGRQAIRDATEAALNALPAPKPDAPWRGPDERRPLAFRLMTLADLEHDVDAYIAAVHANCAEDLLASETAARLITAGRPAEALQWLDRPRRTSAWNSATDIDLRIEALAALGRKDEVQSQRWAFFQRSLSAIHLRAYLKALPDFEDFDAEQKALAIAADHEDADSALTFLVGWPALGRAATLVHNRISALNGRAYDTLRPAAQALEEAYPEAATLLYRHLVESVLDRSSSKHYAYAARDLASASRVAGELPVGAAIEGGEAYLARLRKLHARKLGFWGLIK